MHRIPIVAMLLLVITVTGFSTATAAEDDDSGLAALVEVLADTDDAAFQLDLLKGMGEGLKGRKQVTMPQAWPKVYGKLARSKNAEVRRRATELALAFGDPAALRRLKQRILNREVPGPERKEALQLLTERRVADLAPSLHTLLADPVMRAAALRGLARYKHADTPARIIAIYERLTAAEKEDAVATLAARAGYALELLTAVERGKVGRADISAFTARQIQNLGDKQLAARLKEVWGDVRGPSANKRALIAEFKKKLTPQVLAKANLSAGRLVYSQTCMKCHKLFGEGGAIGPDLTGSNRANLDYVLENALDPSAVIGRDYRLTNVVTLDGELISGIVVEETPSALTLQTQNERVVVSKEDIDTRHQSAVSMMPEGQLEKLTPTQVRDLVAYLASPAQVPLPQRAANKPPAATK